MGDIYSAIPEIVVPDSLRRGKDPLCRSLCVCCDHLSNCLDRATTDNKGFVPVVWAFREAVDVISVVLASCSVAPLSASEAPLPGWRRGLWKSDFVESAGSLVSWAVPYLAKKSGQNFLADSLLKFLYADSAHSEIHPYCSLFGFGGGGDLTQVPWGIWRDKFFKDQDLDEICEIAPQIVNYLNYFNEILDSLDRLLFSSVNIVVKNKKDVGLLVFSYNGKECEIPPFVVVNRCSACANNDSLYLFAAPCHGSRFLYREVNTGHIATFKLEQSFKRRFFTNFSKKEANSFTSTALDSFNSDIIPLVTESVEEVRTKLLSILGEEVFVRWHMPVLAVACELSGSLPLELLKYPGFGIYQGEYIAYRLNGMIAFGEDGGITPRTPQVVDYCHQNYADICRSANVRLTYWAESVLQKETDSFSDLQNLAMFHIVDWALKGKDQELIERLINEANFMPAVLKWFEERLSSNSAEDRRQILEISDKLLQLFSLSKSRTASEQILAIYAFRCRIFRSSLEYSQAKEELDKAIDFISGNDTNRVARAKILSERSLLNLELELPRLADEDAEASADIWSRLADIGDPNAINNLISVTCLRARALLSLGKRSQALSILNKVADRKFTPHSNEDNANLVNLHSFLAKLLQEQTNSNRQACAHFELVLKYAQDLEEDLTIKEAKAKAWHGLVNDREIKDAIEKLENSRDYFEQLIYDHGRKDLKGEYAEVVYQLAFLMEKSSRLDECLHYTDLAIKLYSAFIKEDDSFANRASLAKLWLLRSRIEELNGRIDVAESLIINSLKYYESLIEDSQVRYISDLSKALAKRGSLRIILKDYKNAKDDLELSVERWPGSHDLKNAKAPLARVFLNLGTAYAHMKNVKLALVQFEKAQVISENRNDRRTQVQILSERVWILFYNALSKRAEDDFTALFNLKSEDKNKRNLLGRAISRLRQEKWSLALEDFSEILSKYDDKDNYIAIYGRGLAQLGEGNLEAARLSFSEILETEEFISESDAFLFRIFAQCGLGDCELSEDRDRALEHFNAACKLWSTRAKEFNFDTDEGHLFEAFGLFFVEFTCRLYNAVVHLNECGRTEWVWEPLNSLRNLGVHSVIYTFIPTLSFDAGVELVKCWTSKNNCPEVASITGELLQEIKRDNDPSPTVKLREAWLEYNLASLLLNSYQKRGREIACAESDTLEKLLSDLRSVVRKYELLSTAGLGVREKICYADSAYCLGIVESALSQSENSGKSLAKAKELYTDLRARNGNKGYGLEIALILCEQIYLADEEQNEDLLLYTLDEITRYLADVDLQSSQEKYRLKLIRELDFALENFVAKYASSRDLFVDLLCLPLWRNDEISRFEDVLSVVIKGRLNRGDSSCLIKLIKNWSKRGSYNYQLLGCKLIEVWLDQACSEGAVSSRGLYLLEELVRLAKESQGVVGWPKNFALTAQEALADFYSSEGNNLLAMDYLNEAPSLISVDVNPEDRIVCEAEINLRKAEILMKLNKYADSKELIDECEGTIKDLEHCENLFDKIKSLRLELLLRGGIGLEGGDDNLNDEANALRRSVGEDSPLAKLAKLPSGRDKRAPLPTFSRLDRDKKREKVKEVRELPVDGIGVSFDESFSVSNLPDLLGVDPAEIESEDFVVAPAVSSRRVIPSNIVESDYVEEDFGVKTVAVSVVKPAVDPEVEPVVGTEIEPEVEPIVEPVVEFAAESLVEPAVETVTEPVDKPAVDRAKKIESEKASKAAAERSAVVKQLRSKLNAKFSRSANNVEAKPEGDPREEGRLPNSESRRISLKGAVSDSVLENLERKAASAAAEEPAPRVIAPKAIEVPESLVDVVEQTRLKRERRQARADASLKSEAVKEEERRASAAARLKAKVASERQAKSEKSESAPIDNLANFASKLLGVKASSVITPDVHKISEAVATVERMGEEIAPDVTSENKEEVLEIEVKEVNKEEAKIEDNVKPAAEPVEDDGKSAAKSEAKVDVKTADGKSVTLKLKARISSERKSAKKAELARRLRAKKNEEDKATGDTPPVFEGEKVINRLVGTSRHRVPSGDPLSKDERQKDDERIASMPEVTGDNFADSVKIDDVAGMYDLQPVSAGEVESVGTGAVEEKVEPELLHPVESEKAAPEEREEPPQKEKVDKAESGGVAGVKNVIAINGTLSVRSMLRNLGSAFGLGRASKSEKKPEREKSTKSPEKRLMVYNKNIALNTIDSAFDKLDAGNFEECERALVQIGDNVNSLQLREIGEVLTALLEALNNLGAAMFMANMHKRATDVVEYACRVSRRFLANRYDSAAWPWWGDVERQAGDYCRSMKRFEEACQYYRKSIEIYLKLIDLGVGEASRADALRTLVKLGETLKDMRNVEGAIKNYNDAVAQGTIVIENGFDENLTMAEIYRSRAELHMLNGDCSLANDDFAWALEFYNRDADKNGVRHYMEIANVKFRMAEAMFICGDGESAYKCRDDLTELANYYKKYKYENEAEVINKYIREFDNIATRYV